MKEEVVNTDMLVLSTRNKSGVKGVSFDKERNKWVAQIKVGGKSINLGRYETLEEAAEARRQAERKYLKNAGEVNLIKKARQNKGMTQQMLAELSGVPLRSVEAWERGLRNPKKTSLEKIAGVLGCTVEDLQKS
jgi:DNA-binding XRE family transcriptional regulator